MLNKLKENKKMSFITYSKFKAYFSHLAPSNPQQKFLVFLGLTLLMLSLGKTWITNQDFQMQLLIGCQQSCQPIRSHIRKSRLINHNFILG